jgi:hypothetical protein
VGSRHQGAKDRWHRKSGIGDPKGVSSTLFELANSEIPIRVKDVVSWTGRSRGKGVAGGANAIAGAPSQIGNRGFTRGATLDNEKADFPIGKFPTGDEEGAKWILHRVSGICETRIRERRTRDQVSSDFPI